MTAVSALLLWAASSTTIEYALTVPSVLDSLFYKAYIPTLAPTADQSHLSL